jgi:hypothetical protein
VIGRSTDLARREGRWIAHGFAGRKFEIDTAALREAGADRRRQIAVTWRLAVQRGAQNGARLLLHGAVMDRRLNAQGGVEVADGEAGHGWIRWH